MHRVVGRQVEVARLGLHHRDSEFVGELAELDHRRRVAPDGRGHDQREFGLGDHRRRFLDDAARRLRRGDAERADIVAARMRRRIGEDFAWQRQIDRPARLAHHDVERAVDDGVGRLAVAQLVVPFHELAHHAALVERFLAPVDRAVARGDVAGLGDRRASGREQQRHVVTRGVHQTADRVRGADRDVHHHRRRLAAGAVVAVRHRHRDVLVRHGDEFRKLGIAGVAGNAFHDRREIGSRIGEHILDAALAEPGRDRLRRSFPWTCRCCSRLFPILFGCWRRPYRPPHPCQCAAGLGCTARLRGRGGSPIEEADLNPL